MDQNVRFENSQRLEGLALQKIAYFMPPPMQKAEAGAQETAWL
jgi:hypothetical protein